jgi:hypothetical protein
MPESLLLDYFLAKRVSVRHDTTPAGGTEQDENETRKRARTFLQQHKQVKELFDETAKTVQASVIEVKNELRRRFLHLTDSSGDGSGTIDAQTFSAQLCVGHYYGDFEDYDLVTYPILYDTDVGEADMIDVIRISPEDAKQLINELDAGCHKLAGTALAHFGAFLQKLWRQNDILWGRLDGAERIITSLIPDHPSRPELVGEAQAEIVCETLSGMGEKERFDLLAESLMRTKTRKAEPQLLYDFINRLKANCAHNPTLSTKLEALIDTEKLRQHYLNTFKTHHQVEPESALRSAARATTVIGKMLEGLSERRRVSSSYAAWIARVGQIFWALVEVAVPRSFPNLFFRHLLKLVYFLEALLIAGSTLLVAPDVQKFALTAFGLTAAIHLAVVILGDVLVSRNRWVNLGKLVGGVVLVLLIALGVVTLSGILGVNRSWEAIEGTKTAVQQHSTFVRVGLSVVFLLVFLWSIRGDLRDAWRSLLGKLGWG